MGFLVGVASAVAIGGAIRGTLLPQLGATLQLVPPVRAATFEAIINGGLALLGVITSLAYFHFTGASGADGVVRRHPVIELVAAVGGGFLAVALGVVFAGVYSAALTALIERIQFLVRLVGLG